MFDAALDTSALRETFASRRSIAIRRFLKPSAAESIFEFLDSGMPEDWWWRSTFINSAAFPSVINLRHFKQNLPRIAQLVRFASSAFAGGVFSYAFDRTFRDHHAACRCVMCNLDGFFNQALLQFVRDLTGVPINTPKETFAARYSSGCFLAPHLDAQKGLVGFVLNLTKCWRPEYGGNLHITSADGLQIEELVVPEFNTLFVFAIPEKVGFPHFVSHVAPGVRARRLTLTGWYE